jgi:transaldolase
MKLCIDDANVEKIRYIYEYFPVDGVSTNPSILAKSGRPPFEVLHEIRSIIGDEGELFVQATGLDADTMVKEARRIVSELGKSTLVKIPWHRDLHTHAGLPCDQMRSGICRALCQPH